MNEQTDLAERLEAAMEHYRQGERHQARAVYDRILAQNPHCYEALEWSGEISIQLDAYEDAADFLGRARLEAPEKFGDYANLGLALYELDRPLEAVDNLLLAISKDPEDLVAHSNLGKALYALHHAGDVAYAARAAARWVADFPHIPDARHMGAAVSGTVIPARADADFISDTFDDFSEDFDKKLAELDYRAPQLIGEIIGRTLCAPKGDLRVLDAGCGTGLARPYLRAYAKKLVGVDLSRKMLDKAKARGGYDKLIQTELVSFLTGMKGKFDLCVAADVLCYFGDLKEIFSAAARALGAGGYFTFSLELGPGTIDGYILNASGRYAHNAFYITDCLSACGFTLNAFDSAILRTEYGKPVDGVIVIARRKGFR